MTLAELPEWAAALLEESRVGHLAFLDEDGAPRVQPVTYARVGEALWSAIDDKPKRRPVPARVRRLQADARAALTVDRYDDDWTRLAWVQVLGEVTVLGELREDVLTALAARYAPYRERPPRGPLLRLEPRRLICWRA